MPFPLLPLISATVGAATPYLVDLLTGASKKYKKAQKSYIDFLTRQSKQYDKLAGSSPLTSEYFQTSQNILNNQLNRAADILQKLGSTRNLSAVSLIGGYGNLNEVTQNNLLNILSNAENVRRNLLEKANTINQEIATTNLNQAKENLNAANIIGTNLSSSLPNIMSSKDFQEWFSKLFS